MPTDLMISGPDCHCGKFLLDPATMAAIRTILSCALIVALVCVSPLRAQFHLHVQQDGVASHHGNAQAGHGHAHDDDKRDQRPDTAHNPGDHSHETAVAAVAMPAIEAPLFRVMSVRVRYTSTDPPAFRHYRPPRIA